MALAIFLFTYVFIAGVRLPFPRLDRPGGALVGAVLILSGCATGLPPENLLLDSSRDSRPFSFRQDLGAQPSFSPSVQMEAVGGAGGFQAQMAVSPMEDMPSCGGQTVPPGWPDFSSDDSQPLLAPFLTCSSPADFLALQQRVDMPQLVMRLDDWSAVRLGSLGPIREEAAGPLNRKRTSFVLQSLERYGAANTEILAHFVLDSSHDDDLRDILLLLAQDKRLQELLELLPSLGLALRTRGLNPLAHAERDFEWSDLGRGLARAGKDALSTSPLMDGARSRLMEFSTLRAQLPPPYQQALDAVEREQLARRFSTRELAVGFLDHMTFGVPLGFYGLMVGTGHGAYALSQGRYEQAVRELAPAALLVALYAGGKGARALSEARGIKGVGSRVLSGLDVMESRARALQEVARRMEGLLGVEGVREVFVRIRASREAGRFVAEGGVDAALALYEARGDMAKARPMMSKARPGAAGSSRAVHGTERPGSLASLVDEQSGHTQEVLEAKLAEAEFESSSPRMPMDVTVLEKHRPTMETPPPEARDNPRWREYIAYYERRLGEIKEGEAAKGPLPWTAYEQMRGWFARGLAFERVMVKLLEADAALPRAARRLLGNFDKPRIETNVGVRKPGPGLRYADVLVIEEGESAGRPRHVETFSFKSRDLSGLDLESLKAQLLEDSREALRKYGETLNIRRDSLQPLLAGSNEVRIPRVRLIYEGGKLKPTNERGLKVAMEEVRKKVPTVEVLFQ